LTEGLPKGLLPAGPSSIVRWRGEDIDMWCIQAKTQPFARLIHFPLSKKTNACFSFYIHVIIK